MDRNSETTHCPFCKSQLAEKGATVCRSCGARYDMTPANPIDGFGFLFGAAMFLIGLWMLFGTGDWHSLIFIGVGVFFAGGALAAVSRKKWQR